MTDHGWERHTVLAYELLNWDGVQWFATREKNSRKHVMGGRIRSVDALIGTVRNAQELGWNLYLGLNPSKPRPGTIKLNREDITHWRFVVVDLDPVGTPLAPPSGYKEAHHHIFSGRGHQLWVPLAETVPLSEKVVDLELSIERAMGAYLRRLQDEDWHAGWAVDTTCSDLARVVRCPGSVNQKTGKRSEIISTIREREHFYSEGSRIWRELTLTAKRVLDFTPPAPESAVRAKNPSNLLAVLPHLTIRARAFILRGAESPGRHTACYAACLSLKEAGVPEPNALEWLCWGADRCWDEAGMTRPLEHSFVRRVVREAYRT